MGFGADVKTSTEKDLVALYRQLHPEDLVKFGLIPEFVGRLPMHVTLEELDKESLVRILKEPKNSVVRQYQASLRLDDVTLEFEDAALDAIAERAIGQKTGARGLRSIVDQMMIEVMFEIPSLEGPKQVTISGDDVVLKRTPQINLGQKSA
jgi:ATP-dependent Clp protease ATP-binding subunit ClpX